MKRTTTTFLLLLVSLFSFAQPKIVQRAGPANTVADKNLMASNSLFLPIWTDTTAANTAILSGLFLDSCGAMIQTRSDSKTWKRVCGTPKYWKEIGSGGSSFDSSISTVLNFATVAQMKASTTYLTVPGNLIANNQGFNSAGDGGGLNCYWDGAATTSPDNVTCFRPNGISGGSPGRWFKIFKGRLRVLEGGVKTDGSNQATAVAALTANATVTELVFDVPGVSLAASVNFHSKRMTFENSATIAGSGTVVIDSAYVSAPREAKLFTGTVMATNILSPSSVAWFGAVGNNSTLCDTAFARAVRAGVEYGNPGAFAFSQTTSIYVPPGIYQFAGELDVNRGLILYGDDATTTYLEFPAGSNGIVLTRNGSAQTGNWPKIKNLSVVGTQDTVNYQKAGVYIQTSAEIENVFAYNFPGDGFRVDGSVPTTNANLTQLRNCHAYYNTRFGIFMHGSDGNACFVMAPDLQGNGEAAYQDSSFLGNTVIAGHSAYQSISSAVVPYSRAVAYNPNTSATYQCLVGNTNVEPGVTAGWQTYWKFYSSGLFPAGVRTWSPSRQYFACGSYNVDGVNPVTLLLGCYKEDDDPAVRLNTRSQMIGGFASLAGIQSGQMIGQSNQITQVQTQQLTGAGVTSNFAFLKSRYSASSDLVSMGIETNGQQYGWGASDAYYYFNQGNSSIWWPLFFWLSSTPGDVLRTAPKNGAINAVFQVAPLLPLQTTAGNPAFAPYSWRQLMFGERAPSTGGAQVGDYMIDATADTTVVAYKNTVSGSPGTWSKLYTGNGRVRESDSGTVYITPYGLSQTAGGGTYAATITGIANVGAAVAVSDFTYSQTGGVVTVSGAISMTESATATLTELEITLPVASAFVSSGNLSGTVNSLTIFGYVYANTANGKAHIAYNSPAVGSGGAVRFMLQYKVSAP